MAVVADELAHEGFDRGLIAVATAWERVFPDNKAPDGHHVEKVFIYGNHECYSSLGGYTKQLFPTEEQRKQHVLRLDMGGFWKETFTSVNAASPVVFSVAAKNCFGKAGRPLEIPFSVPGI